MKIGIDASRANREHKSGTEWYAYHLIKKMAQIDPNNEYTLYTDKPLRGGLLDLTKNDLSEEAYKNTEIAYDKKGYQIIKSPHDNVKAKVLNWPFSFFWTLGRLSLEMLLKKCDVLFVPAHSAPLIMPKKTIATVHDVAFNKSEALYRKETLGSEVRFLRKVINFFVRIFTLNKYSADSVDYLKWSTFFTLKHAKKIVAVSESTRRDILESYPNINQNKIVKIYNGFSDFLYNGDKLSKSKEDQVMEKYGLEKPYLLYVGRIERKKNAPLLIEAFAKARHDNINLEENLVMVGDAGYGYDEVIYNITGLDLYNKVFLPGWIEEEDMPYIYSAATAFIFPSKHEGFGIPILQAFGCGTPAAVSCIPPFQEIAKNAVLYFNPVSRGEIAGAINRIINDQGLRDDLIKKGRERSKKFSWEKCAEEILREIESM